MVVVVTMMMVEQHQHVSAVLRIRRALALPIYTVALILIYFGGLLAAGEGPACRTVCGRPVSQNESRYRWDSPAPLTI